MGNVEPGKAIPLEEYESCERAWLGTLEHFGIHRPVMSFEKMKIARLIRAYDWKSVAYALTGMRYELGTDSFNPKNHVSLARIERSDMLFEKFLNLACQKKKETRK